MADVAVLPLAPRDEHDLGPSSLRHSSKGFYRETRLARFAAKRARLDNGRHTLTPSTSEQAAPVTDHTPSATDVLPALHCEHFLARKQRFCDRLPLPSQCYCSHHSEQGRTRCEHCSTLVHNDELAKHVRLCPAAARAEVAQTWPFRVVDVNTALPHHLAALFAIEPAPAHESPSLDDVSASASVLRVDLLVERIRQSLRAHASIQRSSSSAQQQTHLPVSQSTPDELSVRRVTSPLPVNTTPSSDTLSPLSAPSESSPRLRKFSKRRHQQQCAALVHTMVNEQLLQSPHCTVLEMGAGKAGLSHCLLSSDEKDIANVEAVVLVDSDTFKSKWDGKIRSTVAAQRSVERYQLDIKDLHIASLPTLTSPSASCSMVHAVLIGKHLCGAALDWCINAVLHTQPSSSSTPDPTSLPPVVSGLCIASCCHHRCTFDSYCNPYWLHAHYVDRQQSVLLTRLSSWACNDDGRGTAHGWRTSGYEVEEKTVENGARVEYGTLIGCGVDERVAIGRAIKQWLDMGRVELLRSVGYSAHLTLFASSHITRENVAIVAKFDPLKAKAERAGQIDFGRSLS